MKKLNNIDQIAMSMLQGMGSDIQEEYDEVTSVISGLLSSLPDNTEPEDAIHKAVGVVGIQYTPIIQSMIIAAVGFGIYTDNTNRDLIMFHRLVEYLYIQPADVSEDFDNDIHSQLSLVH